MISLEQTEQNNRLVVFRTVVLMFWFAMYTYVPVLGPYVQHLGGSLQMVGLVVGSYGFTQLLLRIPLGMLSDRLKKRKLFIRIGVALAFLSAVGMGFGNSPWLVFAFRSMAGAAAATWVTFTILFSSYFPENQTAKAMGVATFLSHVAQMTATTLGGFIVDRYGWQSPFVLGGVVGLAGLLLSGRITESKNVPGQPMKAKELLSVAADRLLLVASFLAIIVQCVTFSTVYGFTPNHAANIGAAASELGILSLVSTLPAAYGALKSGTWAERMGDRLLLVLAFLVCAVFTIVIPFTTSIGSLYFTQAIAGLGRGVILPVLMALSIRNIGAEKRATAMGFFQSIYALGMFAGPVLVGFIGDSVGLAAGFVAVGILSGLAAILSHVLLRVRGLGGSITDPRISKADISR